MLGDFAVLLIAAVLVNNFVLVQFLGYAHLWVCQQTGHSHWHVRGYHFRINAGFCV